MQPFVILNDVQYDKLSVDTLYDMVKNMVKSYNEGKINPSERRKIIGLMRLLNLKMESTMFTAKDLNP